MASINFNGCKTIDDIYFRHAEQLAGKVLLQSFGVRSPSSILTIRTPIYGVERSNRFVTFQTEDGADHELELPFRGILPVVTSIIEPGDVSWSPNGYRDKQYAQYAIDDLNDNDLQFGPWVAAVRPLPIETAERELVPVRVPLRPRIEM